MAENKQIPAIRFAGFTEAWEQRKLSEITQITMGQSPDGSTYSDKPTDYILIQGNADLENGWVKPRIWTTQKTKTCNAGDLIMSVRAPAGSMGKTKYNAVIGRGVASIKGNEFIYQTLSKMDSDGYWKSISCGSTFESLNSDNIKNAEISIPDNAEQNKLGNLFQNIDNLITLHQRKYDKLVNIKKALLEKMFPQNGSNIPEVRFKGFTEAWEQRKFENIFNYERPDKFIVKSDKYSDDYKTPVLTANKGFILGYTNEINTHDFPCIIFDDFTLDSKYVTFKFMVKSSAMKILNTKSGYNLRFAYERLNSEKIENLGHARHYISVVQPTETLVPKIAEQEKISKLFKYLEDNITLHQCKYKYKKLVQTISLHFFIISWEQRKLNELCSIITKQTGFDYSATIKPSLITEPSKTAYPFIQNKDFDGININLNTDFFIPIETAKRFPKITLDKPSILISISGKIGNIGFYNRKNKAFIGGAVGICKLDDITNGLPIIYQLQTTSGQNYFHSLIKASSHANITVEDIRNIKILLPRKIQEKELVSKFALYIDNLITLHQCKYNYILRRNL